MDKIDLLILSVVVSIMAFCFSLGTRWSFFCAGICATCIAVVLVGRIAHLNSSRNSEGQWEKFIDNLDTPHTVNSKLAEAA